MTKLEWNDQLRLNVPKMDEEHRQLIDGMNRIDELNQRGAGRVELDAALVRLLELTRKHFADEEKYMESIKFAERKLHAGIHSDLLEKLAGHYRTFQQGNGKVPEEFFRFLTYWLQAHIKGIDKKYTQVPAKV